MGLDAQISDRTDRWQLTIRARDPEGAARFLSDDYALVIHDTKTGEAQHTVIVSTESASFFHAMSPAFAVAEVLGAIIAGRSGDAALASLRHLEGHFAALNTHLKSRNNKKSS